MKKTDTTVADLVAMMERGELLLPEMQRRYVRRAASVRDLLDSLNRGYPSGSILVWETDQAAPTRAAAVPLHRDKHSEVIDFLTERYWACPERFRWAIYSSAKGSSIALASRWGSLTGAVVAGSWLSLHDIHLVVHVRVSTQSI